MPDFAGRYDHDDQPIALFGQISRFVIPAKAPGLKEIIDTGSLRSELRNPKRNAFAMNSPCVPTESSSDRDPRANALKHGLCAAKFLSPETLALAESIRAHLVEVHEPWSSEEAAAVDQAALTRAQAIEVERCMQVKVAAEKARASELYERSALSRFQADLAGFRQLPGQFATVLGMTWHGADWFEKLWGRVADLLGPDQSGGSLPFSLACDAAAALGGAWQVDHADASAAWLMTRYVRIAPDPDAALRLWVDRSCASDGPESATALAVRFLARAPETRAEAVADLAAKASHERARWSLQATKLRTEYETAAAMAVEAAAGTGSGDPALANEFRLLSRYLTGARNRADRLERRLDLLKKSRKSLAYRAQRDAEREARRLRKESEKALRRFEQESDRFDNGPLSYQSTTGFPESGNSMQPSPEWESADAAKISDFDCASDRTDAPASGTFEPWDRMAYHDSSQQDAIELRNAVPAAPVVSGHESRDGHTASSPEDVRDSSRDSGTGAGTARPPEKGAANASVVDETPFRDRIRMMRYRNWTNRAEIPDDELDLMRQLWRIPASFERDVAVRALFGSEKVLRRCWNAARTWAGFDDQGDPETT